jgi:hypothetical protein
VSPISKEKEREKIKENIKSGMALRELLERGTDDTEN